VEFPLSDADRAILWAHVSAIGAHNEQPGTAEEKRRILKSPAARRLLTIPGVGEYTAAVIVAGISEIDRLDTDRPGRELRWT
jgi:transposase